MKVLMLVFSVFLMLGCVNKEVREGQRLFAGCAKAVDDKRTLDRGIFVCKGAKDPTPFAGNGRSCGSCHVPGDNFGLSVKRIATLPADDALFFPGLDEDQKLLRELGLVKVVAPGGIVEFRPAPKLVGVRKNCSKTGACDTLGLLGDRTKDLDSFTLQAVANHLSKSVNRVPGVDFRVPTARELKALRVYQRSRLVSDQDDRKR